MTLQPPTSTISKDQKGDESVTQECSFTLTIQKKGQSASRVIELPLEMHEAQTKNVAKCEFLAAKTFKNMTMCSCTPTPPFSPPPNPPSLPFSLPHTPSLPHTLPSSWLPARDLNQFTGPVYFPSCPPPNFLLECWWRRSSFILVFTRVRQPTPCSSGDVAAWFI